jgi:hypothetical protein
MTPLNWAILAGAFFLGVGLFLLWWIPEHRRKAKWTLHTYWTSEGQPPPELATWLEVAREMLPSWLGSWGGVWSWRDTPIEVGYGSGMLSGDRVIDADEGRIESMRVLRAVLHGLWHVNEARHGRSGEPPEAWLAAAEARVAAVLGGGG